MTDDKHKTFMTVTTVFLLTVVVTSCTIGALAMSMYVNAVGGC